MPDQRKYTSKLSNASVLIIGGSSGIGYGVAEASLEHGARVVIASSNAERVSNAVTQLKTAYPSTSSENGTDRLWGKVLDIGTPETIEENLRTLLQNCSVRFNGGLDHIVWTAADSLAVTSTAELDLKTIYAAGTTRFIGPLFLGKLIAGDKAGHFLKKDPASSITFTTGSISERPHKDWTLINAYATGLRGMTRGFALDLQPIRVNIVSPGHVNTPMWKMDEQEKKKLYESVAKGMTTGRVGEVEDVAESYVYLMKDKNVSGSVISTNGGTLLIAPY